MKEQFFHKLIWKYLTSETDRWLSRFEDYVSDCTTVKDYPKRTITLCDGIYIKEVRYRGVQSVLKRFFGGNACREGSVSRELCDLGVPAPDVLGYGQEVSGLHLKRDVLLTREIPDGQSVLKVFFEDFIGFNRLDKDHFINTLAQFFKLLHDKGVSHKDPNLGNIICQRKGSHFNFYIIDTDRANLKGRSMTDSERMKNLSLLHSLHNGLSRSYKLRFLKAYLAESPHKIRIYSSRLPDLALEHSFHIWRKNAKKCLYTNRRFKKEVQDGFKICRQNNEVALHILNHLLPDPDRVLEHADVLKAGRTVSAFMVEHAGRKYFVKRYNYKGFVYGLWNAFRRSRALKSWLSFWELIGRRLPVPEPFLCFEERDFIALRRSYLVTEYIDDVQPLKITARQIDRKDREKILMRVAILLGRLHRSGCVHGDLKWDNFLHSPTSLNLRLYLTDLDGTRMIHRYPDRICRGLMTKDVLRFMKDFKRYLPDQTDLQKQFIHVWARQVGFKSSADVEIMKEVCAETLDLAPDKSGQAQFRQLLQIKRDAWMGEGRFSHKIFILGTGRSGTHWLGYILQNNPDFYVAVEQKPVFGWATKIAVDRNKFGAYYPLLVIIYRLWHTFVAPRNFVDKSHPNIWIAEELARTFDDASFIGIQREVYGTVSSMMEHERVLRWCKEWQKYPVPNPFLGITLENQEAYEKLSLAGRCAVRWKSHNRRMSQLMDRLGDRILVVNYENLVKNFPEESKKIRSFLGQNDDFMFVDIKSLSLEKWKKNLTKDMVADIDKVVSSDNF